MSRLPKATSSGRRVFGVVLAGGESRRFGRPKALAEVGGSLLARRCVDTLISAGLSVGIVADPRIGATLGVRSRPDLEAGLGPLGGLWTALEWARERGDTGVFLLGCDMPLITPDLIRLVVERSAGAAVTAPVGPTGPQPLCALYRLACLPEVEKRARSPDRSLHRLLDAVGATLVSSETIATIADPEVVFWNVNTEEDGLLAEGLLRAAPGEDS